MFCNEPILKVYQKSIEDASNEYDCFFDFFTELAFHTTHGYWLVFETENFFIEIGADGIKPIDKNQYEVEQKGYLVPCDEHCTGIEYISDESIIFVGKRILSIQQYEAKYTVTFDDFTLSVIPYPAGRFPTRLSRRIRNDTPVLGCDRHIKHQCECGGKAEIFLDHVSDFFARCKNCHKATMANMALSKVIIDWNAGNTPCVIDLISDNLEKYWRGKIEYFAVSSRGINPISAQSCDFDSAIIKIDDALIHVEHRGANEDYGTFEFDNCSGYNPEFYSRKVIATPGEPITFLEEIREPDGTLTCVKFRYGDRFLFLYAFADNLTLTKSIVDLEGNFGINDLPDVDDSVLFNG